MDLLPSKGKTLKKSNKERRRRIRVEQLPMKIAVMMRARRLMKKSKLKKLKKTRSHSKHQLNQKKRQVTQRRAVLMALTTNLLATF
jgi:hypothetical protein